MRSLAAVPFAAGRVRISLHRVWQVERDGVDSAALISTIKAFKQLGFRVNLQGFATGNAICYADCMNSAVINYNGDVYKCTARDFNATNRCGVLDSYGIIEWEYEKLLEHAATTLPSICRDCKLLPRCSSHCSTNHKEKGAALSCAFGGTPDFQEHVLLNYILCNS